MTFKSFNRDYKGPIKGSTCLFCKDIVKSNNSFKNVNPQTGEVDYFHFQCFKQAVNNMIMELKKNDESKHGKEDRK